MSRVLIFLAVTTGLRRGELFGLKWEDVDLAGNTQITLAKSTFTVVPPRIEIPFRLGFALMTSAGM